MSSGIVRARTPEEEELALRLAELGELESELAERELALAMLTRELHLFEWRYLGALGALYAELDDLLAEIAEALAAQTPDDPRAQEEAAQARARAEESAGASESHRAAPPDRVEPSEDLKRLYRQVARRVHPDLAATAEDRARRTKLMAEANVAYENGDEERLQAILAEWEEGPEAWQGEDAAAQLERVTRKIAGVRARLAAIDEEIERLKASELYGLKVRVEEAEAQGRDLLAEMAAALEEEIAEARRQLGRLRRREQRA